jgi:hypothetical protein
MTHTPADLDSALTKLSGLELSAAEVAALTAALDDHGDDVVGFAAGSTNGGWNLLTTLTSNVRQAGGQKLLGDELMRGSKLIGDEVMRGSNLIGDDNGLV